MPTPFPRIAFTTTIVGSPALAAETIIATLPGISTDGLTQRCLLEGWSAFTVGATGTAIQFRIRRTGLTGTVVADTGAMTRGVAAAALGEESIMGIDSPGEVGSLAYVMTLQVTGGSSASTVSAVVLTATILPT